MAVNSVTTSNVRKIGGDDRKAGTMVGGSTSALVSFYGTTPIARPAITAVATATATTALNETKIDRLYTALRNLGLVTTGG